MSHHEPLRSLCPIDWDGVPKNDLKSFLDKILSDAQTIIESVPVPKAEESTTNDSLGRARSQTISTAGSGRSDSVSSSPAGAHVRRNDRASAAQALKLRKEWKEVKVNAKENPLNISIFKLSSKDGKGAWFARRSIHKGFSFDAWKRGLEQEFLETMKVQEGPGSGNIRGIGADRRVEHHVIEGMGEAQVFQLSAQFPGPTSPRDFITLLLTSDHYSAGPDDGPPLRQFMIISKPCNHPDCPQRQGIIRGHYESVELIRELPSSPSPPKRAMSAITMATGNTSGDQRTAGPADSDRGASASIEWLMVTRSDPGGSVPRFMVEKGTPPGIVNDAGKFLNWLGSLSEDDTKSEQSKDNTESSHRQPSSDGQPEDKQVAPAATELSSTNVTAQHQQHQHEPVQTGHGLYDMITGAFGAATSVVSGGIIRQFSAEEPPQESTTSRSPPPDYSSDVSSTHSFTSALERTQTQEHQAQGNLPRSLSDNSSSSSHISSSSNNSALPQEKREKEDKKLQERRRKLDEKAARMREKLENKHNGDKEKDAAALAKVREKHEREIAKQEAKYHREMKKLREKQENEERKVEKRRQRAAEKEEKHNLNMALEKMKMERDMAIKKVDLLESQVGQLQSQNTMLVAKLGKLEGGGSGDAGGLSRSGTGSLGKN